jgi:hypothetical protein
MSSGERRGCTHEKLFAVALMEVDVTLDELDESTPAATEQWNRIARATWMHTVSLFALSASPIGDVLTLAGTGTLIFYKDAHYILTAAHVWHKVLKGADKVGITLRETYDHTCLIERENIAVSELQKPSSWTEWGPDLIFLRIPDVRVGEIEAFRVFYSLGTQEKPVPGGEYTEARLLLGTPGALGIYRQNHASVQMTPFWVAPPVRHDHDGFDYLDVQARLPPPSTVDSFGGVSGGGLWRVKVYSDPATGQLDSIAILEGVAFYAFNVQGGAGTVRCHGLKSIDAAVLTLGGGNGEQAV